MFASLQQQHQRARHRALIVGKPRGKTWMMLFPRRAAEELQPSAFSLQPSANEA